MRAVLKLVLFGVVCLSANGDVLKLRDGRVVAGQFLGATRAEIWFQREVPGEVIGTMAYPVGQVESVVFGPDIRPSAHTANFRPGTKSLGKNATPTPVRVGLRLRLIGL